MIVNNKYILNETLTGTITVYLILRKLMQPWEEWDAYKLKIIDKDGKKLRHPVSSKEREAWDMLTRFCWNLKLISNKFVGKSKFSSWFTSAYLLKDSFDYFYIETNKDRLNESLGEITFATQNALYEVISKLDHMIHKEGLYDSNDTIELAIWKNIQTVENMIQLYDVRKLFLWEDGESSPSGGPTVAADIAQQGQYLGQKKLRKFKKKKAKVITNESD